jgi:SAM-dependent methyltransferase
MDGQVRRVVGIARDRFRPALLHVLAFLLEARALLRHVIMTATATTGTRLPFADNSFDFAMFIDVLHHTEDPLKLLREALRVTRKGVIIKDHIVKGFLAYPILRAMDWVGNAPYGVVLPYNYLSEDEWQSAFKSLSLKFDAKLTELGLYPKPFSFFFDRQLHFISLLSKEH